MIIQNNRPHTRYPFLATLGGSSTPLKGTTAQKQGLLLRERQKDIDQKTVLKIFGKKKVERIINISNVIVTIQGIARTIVTGIAAIVRKCAPTSVKTDFSRLSGASSIPFSVIDLGMSMYGAYDGTVHAYKSYQIGDGEGVRHHSLTSSSATVNIGSILAGFVAFGAKVQGLLPLAKTAGAASSILGAIAFGAYAIVESLGLKHSLRAAKRLQTAVNKATVDEEKYLQALKEMKSQIELSAEEVQKAATRALQFGVSHQEEITAALKKKFEKLKRRVGQSLALEMNDHLGTLYEGICSNSLQQKRHSITQAENLIKRYRSALNVDISLRVMKVVGAITGTVACALSLSNPITSGILIGISTVYLMVAWYGSRYWEESTFEKANLLNVYNRYTLPTAQQILARQAVVIERQTVDEKVRRLHEVADASLNSLHHGAALVQGFAA